MHETVQIKRLREVAARRGWAWTGEPSSGFCGRLATGARRWFVIGADLGVNAASAARIARDKVFAQLFLAQAGLPTIPTHLLHSLDDAEAITSYPILLKPNEGHGGAGISIADRAHDIAAAYRMARAVCPIVLGQPVIRQREFRIVVFDGRPLLAYEKKPLTLVGDGVRSIRELMPGDSIAPAGALEPKYERLSSDQLTDLRVTDRLNKAGLLLETILPAGATFVPLPVANLTSGGTWRECLAELSPAMLEASIAAAAALGLVMAGIDLFSESPAAGSFLINEVNASPGLQCLAAETALLDPLFAAIEEYLSRH